VANQSEATSRDSIRFESKGRSEREGHLCHYDKIEQTNGTLQ